MKDYKTLSVIFLLIIIFSISACAGNVTESLCTNDDYIPLVSDAIDVTSSYIAHDYNITDDSEQDLQYDVQDDSSVEIVQILPGDTFFYQTMTVTLGTELVFASYSRSFDFNTERFDFPPFWETPGVLPAEKAIYIPVSVFCSTDDPRMIGSRVGLLVHTNYYTPIGQAPLQTRWHNPGGEPSMHLFPFIGVLPMDCECCTNHIIDSAVFEPFFKSHIRLDYVGDGEYVLPFILYEAGWDTDVIRIYELSLNITWPQTGTEVVVASIERQPNESAIIGNFLVSVGSEVILCGDEYLAMGITLFPVSVTNIAAEHEHLSTLNPVSLNCNSGYPRHITAIRYNGVDMQLSDFPPIAPGETVDFYLPVVAVVCENSAAFRPFRLTETRTSDSGNIEITHNHYIFCLPFCTWCNNCPDV